MYIYGLFLNSETKERRFGDEKKKDLTREAGKEGEKEPNNNNNSNNVTHAYVVAVTPTTLLNVVEIGKWIYEEQNGDAEAEFDVRARRTASVVHAARGTLAANAKAGCVRRGEKKKKKKKKKSGKRALSNWRIVFVWIRVARRYREIPVMKNMSQIGEERNLIAFSFSRDWGKVRGWGITSPFLLCVWTTEHCKAKSGTSFDSILLGEQFKLAAYINWAFSFIPIAPTHNLVGPAKRPSSHFSTKEKKNKLFELSIPRN